eukprot:Sspe_Gene.42219::Locus_20494_Transcript_5_5_Confidence_0.556_Length_364::g.42219::m.42219
MRRAVRGLQQWGKGKGTVQLRCVAGSGKTNGSQLPLPERTFASLLSVGITDLRPWQLTAFNAMVEGSDILINAHEGAGKSVVTLLGVIERVLRMEQPRP